MLLYGTGLRLASLFALLFMAFFTLLTLVIAVWNPLDDCGCFGNALKLSNWMTFAKNVVLLPVAAVVWRDAKRRRGFVFTRREAVRSTIFLLLPFALCLYAWYCLPPVDTSVYRKGTDLRRDVLCTSCMERSVVLVYEDLQTGGLQEFSLSDTTWYDTARWRYPCDLCRGYGDSGGCSCRSGFGCRSGIWHGPSADGADAAGGCGRGRDNGRGDNRQTAVPDDGEDVGMNGRNRAVADKINGK